MISRTNLLSLLTIISISTVGCTINQPTSPVAVNTTVTVTESDPIVVGPTTEELTDLTDQGQLYNEDYSFLIDVGAEHSKNITAVAITPFDGVTATYLYCYATVDTSYSTADCPTGTVETFRINVFTAKQYEAIKDGPGAGSLINETAGYVYELNHPNGLLPDDVPATDEFYDGIIASFNFAG